MGETSYNDLYEDQQLCVDRILESALIMSELIQGAVGEGKPFEDMHEPRYLIRRWSPIFEDNYKETTYSNYRAELRDFLISQLKSYASMYNWENFIKGAKYE